MQSHSYTYTLTGNTLLPEKVLREVLLQAPSPQVAVSLLRERYLKAGYPLVAVRASVNNKDIRIEIVQGRLTKIAASPIYRWFYWGLKDRDTIQTNEITYRSVLATNYASRNGQRLDLSVAPSSQPGGAELYIKQSPLPGYQALTGNVLFGNYGSRYAGRYVTGGSLSYNPGLGLNFSVSATQGLPSLTAASAKSQYTAGSLTASSVTPFGIYSFTGQWTHYRIGQVAYPLNPDGNIFQWTVSGNQLLYANTRMRVSVSEGFSHVGNSVKVYKDVIPGGYPLTTQHYGYWFLGTQFSDAFQLFGNPGSINGGLTYNQGIAPSSGTLNNSIPSYPAGRFHYFVANLSWQQGLPYGMRLSLNAQGQGAFDTLPQQQQWVLGGFGNLSAFYPGILVGDSGYSGRLQLQSPTWTKSGFHVSGNLFAEIGGTQNVYLPPNTPPWQSLSDVGLGLSLQSPWGTSISAISAIPIGWNDVSAEIRKADRVDAFFVISQTF